jgi:hypothetical protein
MKRHLSVTSVGFIGPRSTRDWNYVDLFELTPPRYFEFRNYDGQSIIRIAAELNYTDPFQGRSNIKWCWAAATNERVTDATTCDRVLELLLIGPRPPF